MTFDDLFTWAELNRLDIPLDDDEDLDDPEHGWEFDDDPNE